MITIKVEKDYSCEMAKVYDNTGNGMEGNFWDFHNGCHGLYEFDNFNSVSGFVSVLRKYHEKKGNIVEVTYSNYIYQ